MVGGFRGKEETGNGTGGERCWKQKLKEEGVFILEETNQKGNFCCPQWLRNIMRRCSSEIFTSWKADFLASLDLFCSFSTFKSKIRPRKLLQLRYCESVFPCCFLFIFFACLSLFNKHLLRNYSVLVIMLGSRDLKTKKTQSLPSRSSLTALGSSSLCACLLFLLEDEIPEYSFASAMVQCRWLTTVGLTDVGWIK